MNSDNETGSMVSLRDSGVKIIDVPDLVNLIADFCDDESISKLSRVLSHFYLISARLARM